MTAFEALLLWLRWVLASLIAYAERITALLNALYLMAHPTHASAS